MTFTQAVATCLSKFVDFSGRASRSEYWWFYLFTVILSIVATIIDTAMGMGDSGIVQPVVGLILLLPTVAAGARRLHDTGRTGWWQIAPLAVFIPFAVIAMALATPALFAVAGLGVLVVVIALLVFMASSGDEGPNRFGENPLQRHALA